jgi:hypothetical protein
MPLGPHVGAAQWVRSHPSHPFGSVGPLAPSSPLRVETLTPTSTRWRCRGRLAAADLIRPPPALSAGEIGARQTAVRRCTVWSASIWISPPFLLAPNPAVPRPLGSVKLRHSTASLALWRRRGCCRGVMGRSRSVTPGLAAAWRCRGWPVPPCRHGTLWCSAPGTCASILFLASSFSVMLYRLSLLCMRVCYCCTSG